MTKVLTFGQNWLIIDYIINYRYRSSLIISKYYFRDEPCGVKINAILFAALSSFVYYSRAKPSIYADFIIIITLQFFGDER